MDTSKPALPTDHKEAMMSAFKVLETLIATTNQSFEFDTIINDALDKIMGLFQCRSSHIRLTDFNTNELVVAAHRGYSADDLAHLTKRRKYGEGLSAIPVKSGEVLIIEDLNTDMRYSNRDGFARRIGVRSLIYFPLRSRGNILGDIMINYDVPRIYSPEEIQLFIVIGHLIGSAIENARSYTEKLKEIAQRKRTEEALAEHAARLEIANNKLESLSHFLKIASEELEAKVSERTTALHEVTQRLQLAIASGCVGIFDRDIESGEMFWNDEMYEVYGLSKESFTPTYDAWQSLLHPDDYDRVMEANRSAIRGEGEFNKEFRVIAPDGTVKWIKAYSKVIHDLEGKIIRIIGINHDISNQKILEINLQTSLREKETLLKEIHHRVKNNLQIVSSLLSMQERHAANGNDLNILRESRNRIKAMADVHSMLYKSKSFYEINFGQYMSLMASQLFSSYKINPDAITLSVNAEDVMLSIDFAIPCGLIFNELVCNALKHAFPDNRNGEIKVELKKINSGIRILFEDNGIGFPETIDFRNTDTLGLNLINLLVEQLDGHMELHRNKGTRYVITLKREEPRFEKENM